MESAAALHMADMLLCTCCAPVPNAIRHAVNKIVLWNISLRSQIWKISIDIYIHTKPLFTIQSKYFKKWKNIDTTNSHSASSNCRKLAMYQPFMSWPYIPRSWGESVSKEAIAMDVRTAIGDCGANSCCNHRAINPWTCAWLCPGSNIKKRNN